MLAKGSAEEVVGTDAHVHDVGLSFDAGFRSQADDLAGSEVRISYPLAVDHGRGLVDHVIGLLLDCQDAGASHSRMLQRPAAAQVGFHAHVPAGHHGLAGVALDHDALVVGHGRRLGVVGDQAAGVVAAGAHADGRDLGIGGHGLQARRAQRQDGQSGHHQCAHTHKNPPYGKNWFCP